MSSTCPTKKRIKTTDNDCENNAAPIRIRKTSLSGFGLRLSLTCRLANVHEHTVFVMPRVDCLAISTMKTMQDYYKNFRGKTLNGDEVITHNSETVTN
jgi:hypothetical protein